VLTLAPSAKADLWNKRTVFTFSGPVEIPGAVLPAGTYVFKLFDSSWDRHIVQVFNERENHIFATVMAIPNYRMLPAEKTVLTFYETVPDVPPAVRAWFYPGDNFGQEFVYPKGRAIQLAAIVQQPAPPPAVVEAEPALVAAPEPTPAPAETASAPAPAPEPAPEAEATPEQEPAPQPAPETPETPAPMPTTASDLPLIALLAGVSIVGAVSARKIANR